jgi:glycosyltransferase involved in cell wall biosynthesis
VETPQILFASVPRSEEELTNRGVYLLLEAAKKSSDVHYHLLCREWKHGYTSLAAMTKWIRTERLSNTKITNNVVPNMQSAYAKCHFTVIPYIQADGGKECPLSLIEGLACGLPVLISSLAPFSEFVAQHGCGVVFDPTPSNLVAAVENGLRQYRELSANAVNVAHRYFSLDELLQRMECLYQEIIL